ncbi:MAG: metallophosphoesterase family protein [Actinomycetota bacterium]|nr:metallophosphoesterase family protein [Actinomycetota bacterium]
MRILAFSDLHRDRRQAGRLVEMSADADLVIGAGDFASIHKGLTKTIEALAAIATPAVLVPGNNETADALREVAAAWEAATVLHGEAIEIGGRRFVGLGGGIPVTPWDWSYDLSDEEAAAKLGEFTDADVLVLHSPPQGHCDVAGNGMNLGSAALAEAVERLQPELAVCGHIHESWGSRSKIGDTEIANLGPEGVFFDVDDG